MTLLSVRDPAKKFKILMKSYPLPHRPASGFTLIEILLVIAVIAILSMLALPSYYYKMVGDQIASITPLLTVAQAPVAASWSASETLPANNTVAGLPSPDKMVGNYVSSVQIVNGVVNVTFSNRAMPALNGRVLSYRPAVVPGSPIVPITWVCGNASAPPKMVAQGVNQTTIAAAYLPRICK